MGQQWGWVVPRCEGMRTSGIAAEDGNPGSIEEALRWGACLGASILPRYRAIVIFKPATQNKSPPAVQGGMTQLLETSHLTQVS